MRKSGTFHLAFRDTLPVMAGYLVLGAGFGILLTDQGWGWGWAVLMSMTVYAGSMQYAAVSLLASGASLLAAALMTLMVNIRHVFYGVTMLEAYRNTGMRKPYLIFSLTDETFSLVCSPSLPQTVSRADYFFLVSLLNQIYWVLGSAAGGVIGHFLPFDTTGVDFAMTALFVVIFVEQWEKTEQHLPAVGGVAVSLACLLLFGAEDFLVPSMLGITVLLLAARHRLGQSDDDKYKWESEKESKHTGEGRK